MTPRSLDHCRQTLQQLRAAYQSLPAFKRQQIRQELLQKGKEDGTHPRIS